MQGNMQIYLKRIIKINKKMRKSKPVTQPANQPASQQEVNQKNQLTEKNETLLEFAQGNIDTQAN